MTETVAAPPEEPGQALRQAAQASLTRPEPPLGRNQPLVPPGSIAGRALITVIAIMTFLAGLTTGAAQLVAEASSGWRSEVAREVTIQVRPTPGRDLKAEVARAAEIARSQPGIADVRVYTKAESERLLEPWLGSGLNFDELPVPRMIVLRSATGATPDYGALRKALVDSVRGALLDDHRLWVERLSTMANTLVALGIGIVLLVITATALAVGFATRGAMAGNKEIIEVLHFVGATDSYIARQFQKHFLKLGLRGGGIGGALSILFFLALGGLANAWIATPGGDQVKALFGAVAIGWMGLVAIVAIALLVAVVTALVSRLTVRHTLDALG
jgi:cell division transport system permease protein